MSSLGTDSRPLRVAVIGSGPSGFYATEALFKSDKKVQVDMFDRLPSPFGLVRAGVAPDHSKIKNVIRIYEKIAENENFSFFGNVCIGKDISVEDLKKHYDAIIFAVGAETDKKLGIPGEDLTGSYTATEFVGWYNGHPDYRDRVFDLSNEIAVIIGQGNVAMDVSRILAKTVDELKTTDIAAHALDQLAESKVKEIHLVGRRGPVQAAFTQPEIKEFGELADCDPVFHNTKDMELGEACKAELELPDSQKAKKNWDVLQGFVERGAPSKSKRFVIHFFQSPVELKGDGKLETVVLEKNALSGEAGSQKARGTGETEELKAGLLFRSVGYRGIAIPGVPFHDSWGVFPNTDGRIVDGDTPVTGLYAAGWIKRGPSGVIGTNKPDSVATVEALLGDIDKLTPCAEPDTEAVKKLIGEKSIKVVSYADWKKIDQAEIANGEPKGKPREKFTRVNEMLAVLNK